MAMGKSASADMPSMLCRSPRGMKQTPPGLPDSRGSDDTLSVNHRVRCVFRARRPAARGSIRVLVFGRRGARPTVRVLMVSVRLQEMEQALLMAPEERSF